MTVNSIMTNRFERWELNLNQHRSSVRQFLTICNRNAWLLAGFAALSIPSSIRSEDTLTDSQKETYAPLIERGLDVQGFTLLFGDDQVHSVMVSPPADH